MKVNEFINQYKNYPIIFMGAGMTQRYYKNAFNWDQLLSKLCFDLTADEERYLNLKYDNKNDLPLIASILEREFDETLKKDRNGKFKYINDVFFDRLKNGQPQCSRMKLYLSTIISELRIKDNVKDELDALINAKKNICSIVTTNYDSLVEDVLGFQPLVGNDIIMSNPYGAVYKIHGSVDRPDTIVLTKEDYHSFDLGSELIKAQLISLFIHNPIIFMGYSMNDNDIKSILETIFKYVEPNTELSERIQRNFLLVDYEYGLTNTIVEDYSITLQQNKSIRINKIRTDDFIGIYKAIAGIKLPISVMDIRKVEAVVRKICISDTADSIQVRITDDVDSLENKDTILAIGSEKTIKYEYLSTAEMVKLYFDIMDKKRVGVLSLIDKHNIQASQYFPIFGFITINADIRTANRLKTAQERKLNNYTARIKQSQQKKYSNIGDILSSDSIALTYKTDCIIWNVSNKNIKIEDFENYLRDYKDKTTTNYRKMLCLYDMMMYKDNGKTKW